MDFFEVVGSRYSCRAYHEREVEDGKLEEIMEAARIAPSASNRQEWRFIVVSDAGKRERLAEIAHNQKFLAQAPIVIAACAVTDGHVMACGQACYPINVAIALEHVSLAATALGLASCWIGAFEEGPARKLLGVPSGVRIVQLMSLGYPADKCRPRTRLPLAEILMHDAWQG